MQPARVRRTQPARKAAPRPSGRALPARPARNGASRPPARALGSASRGRPPRRTPERQRYVAAGQILGVGLICFALWCFFDARQLYTNAVASPPGTRRTVSMDLLGPIARVEEFFGADRLVDGGNRALGRASTPPSLSQTLPTQPPPAHHPHRGSGVPATGASAVAPGTGVWAASSFDPFATNAAPGPGTGLGVLRRHVTSPFGVTSPPSAGSGSPPSASSTAPSGSGTTPASSGLPPLVTPSPAHPLSVLEIGDSLGVDLGYGLQDVLGQNRAIRLSTKAVIDTGLANVAYYNWPAQLAQLLKTEHPGLVIVMVGGNDTQNFAIGQRAYVFGTPAWRAAYLARVEALMREATSAGAHVAWVGMPQMAPGAPVTSAQMATLDSVYEQAARTVPDVLYVPTWKVLANNKGQYSTFLPNASGSLVAVRDPDGVHIDYPAGDDLVANAIVKALREHWKVQL
ncbi:MAG: DUF459 domain-containing protein [Actinomycetota bacterium]|nr:DUF459 domain-containing protein [Actinomycetota bacterium]